MMFQEERVKEEWGILETETVVFFLLDVLEQNQPQ